MSKVIICQGLPASGKSTWAKKWVSEDPKHRVRFNRDDVRNMLGTYWVPSREFIIDSVYDSFMNEAMMAGYDIVLDNMNLNKKTINEIIKYVEDFNRWISLSPMNINYTIEYKQFFNVPLEELIERDSKRDHPIGKDTISKLYNKYKPDYDL